MPVFVVERDLKGISMHQLGAAQQAAIKTALQCTTEGMPVSYMRSIFTPGEGRCHCLFLATDADAVRALNERAGLPFTRIVEALDLPPPAR